MSDAALMHPTFRDRQWWPLPPDLAAAPELGVLAVVRAAVEITVAALLAETGALTAADDELLAACAQAARRIIDDAGQLTRAIDDYRGLISALVAADPAVGEDVLSDDDIPF